MLARKNAHPRDARITFSDKLITLPNGKQIEDHAYTIELANGEKVTWRNSSVTRLMADYFPNRFDPVKAYRGNTALQKQREAENYETVQFGKLHHHHFEYFLDGQPFTPWKPERYPQFTCYEDLPGWTHFCEFLKQLDSWWVPFRVEWLVFSTEAKLPGTIDLVLRDSRFPDELVLMVVDYKINKGPTDLPWCDCGNYKAETAAGHSPNCQAVGGKPASRNVLRKKCNVAAVQVSIYAWILENLYGARVTELMVAYLHPNYPMYLHRPDTEECRALVEDMIKSRLE